MSTTHLSTTSTSTSTSRARVRRTRRTGTLAAAVLAGLLALTACGGDDPVATAGSGDAPAASSSDVPESAPYNAQDVSFAQGMVPHHEQAVEMAELVLAQDPGPEVAALAREIQAAQEPEITQLQELLAAWGADGGSHSGGHGGHAGTAGVAHEGMMSEEQMTALRTASGAEAERLFLELMVEHHEGAVAAAEAQLAGGEDAEALALAEQIVRTQEREISRMQRLLSRT